MKQKSMKRIRLCALIIAGIFILYLGINVYTERTVRKSIDDEIQKIEQYADIRYDDLDVDILNSSIRLEGMIITPRIWKEEIRVDKGIFYDTKTEEGIPRKIRFNLEGIHLNLSRSNTYLKTHMESMKLNNVKANLDCFVSYDERTRTLDIKHIKLGAAGVGKAELNLRLRNIDLDTIGSLPNNIVLLLITLSGVAIEGAEIRYQDETLMDKIIILTARQNSQPVDAYYEHLIQQLEQAADKETDPDAKKAIKGIQDFMMKKDKVSITLAPETPTPLSKLYWIRDLKPLVDLLGIKVAA